MKKDLLIIRLHEPPFDKGGLYTVVEERLHCEDYFVPVLRIYFDLPFPMDTYSMGTFRIQQRVLGEWCDVSTEPAEEYELRKLLLHVASVEEVEAARTMIFDRDVMYTFYHHFLDSQSWNAVRAAA